ncbi:hypothetical protein ZWY2020_054235 [Hordeum vulgare]|nr:hypothetical protein ZWY2020_054235 [Hordeum vulgare]
MRTRPRPEHQPRRAAAPPASPAPIPPSDLGGRAATSPTTEKPPPHAPMKARGTSRSSRGSHRRPPGQPPTGSVPIGSKLGHHHRDGRHYLQPTASGRASATSLPDASHHVGAPAPEYLVNTYGLTRPQVLKASKKLSHLKSPVKPHAVLAFLSGLGLSDVDVVAVVAKDPQFLSTVVGKTLAPVVAGLTGLGLSRHEITRLVSLARCDCRVTELCPIHM